MFTLAQVMILPVLALGGILMFGRNINAYIMALQFFLIGFGNCGADSVIGGAFSFEYGGSQGTRVTSLVNGIGSLGGLVEGPIIAYLIVGNNWNPVMFLLFICSILPVILFCQIKHTTRKNEDVEV